jgi:hypothetical protein
MESEGRTETNGHDLSITLPLHSCKNYIGRRQVILLTEPVETVHGSLHKLWRLIFVHNAGTRDTEYTRVEACDMYLQKLPPDWGICTGVYPHLASRHDCLGHLVRNWEVRQVKERSYVKILLRGRNARQYHKELHEALGDRALPYRTFPRKVQAVKSVRVSTTDTWTFLVPSHRRQ